MVMCGGLSMENKNYTREDAYKTLNMINEWIRSSDTKTSILMTMVALFSSLSISMFETLKNIISFSANPFLSTIIVIVFVLYIFLFIVIFYFSFISLVARICIKNINSKSLFFFGNIADLEKNEFIEKTSKIVDKDIINDLKEQIVINSKIAKMKLKYFNYSLKASIFLLLCETILLVIYMFN